MATTPPPGKIDGTHRQALMASVKVLAGDFMTVAPSGVSSMFGTTVISLTPHGAWSSKGYNLKTDVVSLTLANEQDGVRAFGAVGWGALGALVAGPVGALVGGLLGGRGKDVTFIAEFTDGKKVLARTDSRTWEKMLAARF